MMKKYGRLKKLLEEKNKFLCICDCGVEKYFNKYSIIKGYTKSCGCLRKELLANKNKTHGMSRSPENNSWRSMMTRCYNKNYPKYRNYGGRGIKVCLRWHKFENFFNDMGVREKGKTLDRINNNKNYSPKNCRWADNRQQSLNKRTSRKITAFGVTKNLKEWVDFTGINRSVITRRLKKGKSPETALTRGVAR
jgi:hypothetical protein